MEDNYGCILTRTSAGGQLPAAFTGSHHVHLLVRQGEMSFSDGKNVFTSRKDDLVIWQMSNTIQDVEYSGDFEADVLLASPAFLQQYNPEMVWASKGFLFIRINPSFHLDEESLRLMNADFELFRLRLGLPDNSFKREVLGRVMQNSFLTCGRCASMGSRRWRQTTTRHASSCDSSRWLSSMHGRSARWLSMPTNSASRRSISRR